MSVETVKEYLKKWGKDSKVKEFSVSSATVDLAAKALAVEPARIAKSIALKDDDHGLLIVAAGDAKIDNAKFKQVFGMKAKMLDADEVLKYTGHAVGGVCPFALPEGIRVCLDVSMKRFDTIFPACGSSNSCIEMTCEELATCAQTDKWVDVCKGW
jgi:prolyl-tRNA editing enzyme YbaK/EbsC (Cys-tRNA(Pro) deacylase)